MCIIQGVSEGICCTLKERSFGQITFIQQKTHIPKFEQFDEVNYNQLYIY